VAVEVTMPKFGLTMHEGTVQRYFKAPGDAIAAGEPLYEVETEKVLYEVAAPAAGTLAVAVAGEGATVECGALVAVIAEAGEDIAAIASRYVSSAVAAATSAEHLVSSARPSAAARATVAPAGGGHRAVSPVARKLAEELGIDLDRVSGTGPGGRVTREDVERAAQPGAKSVTAAAKSAPPSPTGAVQHIPLRGTRKIIAERMHASLRDSAQITITSEADVTPATELRARLRNEFDLTYTDMIVHAVSRGLLRHPRMNSRLESAGLVMPATVAVGIAVALDDGLIVPVIHDAARRSLREIAAESKMLGQKARAGMLKLEDVTGGTFTVTNLGMYGIDAFTPILNQGETGILGVGRIVEKPAVYGGEIARRAMMTFSLTFDHRVIDGAPAAEFLRSVIEILNHNHGER
jgi:pyruvate dehydrogenase E2 component (dihydrolipoyllysine-residue acetyltransferase)